MEKSNRDWKDIAKDLADIVINYANQSARKTIEEKKKEFGKKAISVVLLLTGSLFLLNGLAQFINQMMIASTWHGYVIVGSFMVLIGIFFTKD